MAKEKNDFLNVLDFTRDFNETKAEQVSRHGLQAFYMQQILEIQLGMLQQLTMISKHCEQFAKALTDIAAEVKRTAEKG